MAVDYVRAADLDDALGALREGGDEARPLAGGQSLIPMLNLGLARPELLVDIGGIPDLVGLTRDPGSVLIRAGTRYADVVASTVAWESVPLLVEAIAHVGNHRVRNVGTIGGSVCHADPAAEIPLVLTALGATYTITSCDGTRTLAAEEFASGYYMTAIESGELLTDIRIPVAEDVTCGFSEYTRRAGDFALVAAAAVIRWEQGAIAEARLALAGVGPTPIRARQLEESLVGRSAEEARHEGLLSADAVHPVDDPFVPVAYRQRLAQILTSRVLADALDAWEGK